MIIGTGDRYTKINPEITKWLIKNKINNFEILPTVIFSFFLKEKFYFFKRFSLIQKDKAINAFNFLIAEDRFVAAALIPSSIKREVDSGSRRIIERAELYKEIEQESLKKIEKERQNVLKNLKEGQQLSKEDK